MIDGLHQEDVGVENAGKLYDDAQVNEIVRQKLHRANERLRNEYEEKYTKAQVVERPAIDEDALLEKAANLAQARLQESWQKAMEQQENEKQNAEHLKHVNQYLEHVKDLEVNPEEDPCGLFSKDGVQHYGALLITAGKLNLENTKEILQELAKKPEKLMNLTTAAREKNEAIVKAAFKKINDSIQKNKEALAEKPDIYSPVSHSKPSAVGSSSGKKIDWKNGVRWSHL